MEFSPASPTIEMALLDPAVVACRIHVPVRTLANWRYRGEGPNYVKIGKRVLYRSVDVTAYIEARVVTPSRSA